MVLSSIPGIPVVIPSTGIDRPGYCIDTIPTWPG